jgi:hypothetical protein
LKIHLPFPFILMIPVIWPCWFTLKWKCTLHIGFSVEICFCKIFMTWQPNFFFYTKEILLNEFNILATSSHTNFTLSFHIVFALTGDILISLFNYFLCHLLFVFLAACVLFLLSFNQCQLLYFFTWCFAHFLHRLSFRIYGIYMISYSK